MECGARRTVYWSRCLPAPRRPCWAPTLMLIHHGRFTWQISPTSPSHRRWHEPRICATSALTLSSMPSTASQCVSSLFCLVQPRGLALTAWVFSITIGTALFRLTSRKAGSAAVRYGHNAILHALCVRNRGQGAANARKRRAGAEVRRRLHRDDTKR